MPNFADHQSLVPTVERWLVNWGPVELYEIVEMLADEGFDLGPDPEQFVEDELTLTDSFLGVTSDERWFNARSLVLGRIFTHRLTTTEIEHDVLDLVPDLCLTQGTEAPETSRLVDGAPVSVVLPESDAELLMQRGIPEGVVDRSGSMLLPPGSLQGLAAEPGDTIGVRVTRNGLDLTRPEPPTGGGEATELAGVLHDEMLGSSQPALLITVLQSVCVLDDGYFREPMPPVTDLLEAAETSREGEWVGPAGFDFAAWRHGRQRESLLEDGLDAAEADLVVALSALLNEVSDWLGADETVPLEQAPGVVEGLKRVQGSDLSLLMQPLVSVRFQQQALRRREKSGALILLVELLGRTAGREIAPALQWLLAKAYERSGRMHEAETALQRVHRLDPTWPVVMIDLIRFASDRGDAVGGLALMAEIGGEPIVGVQELFERFRPKPGPVVGRNEPCWCGSGRKFKQCHLNRPQQPAVEDRAFWLYQKACMFLGEEDWKMTVMRFDGGFDEDDPAGLRDAERVMDTVLFEGGGFADFLATRGELLPDDERLLAEQWLLVDRSVFEVESTKPGESMSVRDVRTGDRHVLRERTASRVLKKGNLFCGRVAPAGDTMQVFGGIEPLSLQHRDPMMALLDDKPMPAELLDFFAAMNASPTIINTEGDLLVWCDAVLHSKQLGELTARLGREFDHDETTESWNEGREVDGQNRLIATIRKVGDDLHASTNSQERMDDLLERLKAWDPTLTIVSEQHAAMPDLAENELEESALSPQESAASRPPDSPELLAALSKMILDYEQHWLDESIPALKGLTPRDAAVDSTRREDLIALLDSFPSANGQGGVMDKERLRKSLGLPPGDSA